MPIITLPDQSWLNDVTAPQGVELAIWDVATPVEEVLGPRVDEVKAVVLPYLAPVPALPDLNRLPNLTAVLGLSAGFDNLVGRIPANVTFSNAAGVHDASTAELTVGLVLASLRGLDEAARDAATGRWNSIERTSLADRNVLMVGVGNVGSAIIRRLEPFEVTVTRVGSRVRDDASGHVHGLAELPHLLPEHDVVIVVVPLTEDTTGLIDDAFLSAMPDGALLVNVARGPVAVTDALVAHAGRLHLALDVTDPEPLPADHPLWRKENVLISPHVGGRTTAFRPRAVRQLNDQFARIARGERPAAIVMNG